MNQPNLVISIDELVLMGCDEQDCRDWFSIRKKRLTARGLKTIIGEGNKLGWPLSKVVKKMADKQWVGFEASWIKVEPKKEKEQMGFIERITDTSWADGL
jgi:hypothetical protein